MEQNDRQDTPLSLAASRVMREMEFIARIPQKDDKGNPILDAEGKEIFEEQVWVYKFDLLSPVQWRKAEDIWRHKVDILSSTPTPSFQELDSIGAFDLDREAYKHILIRRHGTKENGYTYDLFSFENRFIIAKAAATAYDHIRGHNDAARLQVVKDNFFSARGIPREASVRQFVRGAQMIQYVLSSVSQNQTVDVASLAKSLNELNTD